MSNVVVIGIDPAPSKDTVVCTDFGEGLGKGTGIQFDTWENTKVKTKLEKFCTKAKEKNCKVLITWDAPLTGPDFSMMESENFDSKPKKNTVFTKRPIEKIFKGPKGKGDWWQKNPVGISVQGYGSCPHWTISKHVLGLPHIGGNDLSKQEYELLVSDEIKLTLDKPVVAEVHPALAMWLWLSSPENSNADINWEYKQDPKNCEKIFAKLKQFVEGMGCPETSKKSDDHLDAWVAWVLGKQQLQGDKSEFGKEIKVRLVGNRNTGAMLLPVTKDTHIQMNTKMGIENKE